MFKVNEKRVKYVKVNNEDTIVVLTDVFLVSYC